MDYDNDCRVEPVYGDSGELLGREIYQNDKLIDFLPYDPDQPWMPGSLTRGRLVDPATTPAEDTEHAPQDTCCGCGGCFQNGSAQ